MTTSFADALSQVESELDNVEAIADEFKAEYQQQDRPDYDTDKEDLSAVLATRELYSWLRAGKWSRDLATVVGRGRQAVATARGAGFARDPGAWERFHDAFSETGDELDVVALLLGSVAIQLVTESDRLGSEGHASEAKTLTNDAVGLVRIAQQLVQFRAASVDCFGLFVTEVKVWERDLRDRGVADEAARRAQAVLDKAVRRAQAIADEARRRQAPTYDPMDYVKQMQADTRRNFENQLNTLNNPPWLRR